MGDGSGSLRRQNSSMKGLPFAIHGSPARHARDASWHRENA